MREPAGAAPACARDRSRDRSGAAAAIRTRALRTLSHLPLGQAALLWTALVAAAWAAIALVLRALTGYRRAANSPRSLLPRDVPVARADRAARHRADLRGRTAAGSRSRGVARIACAMAMIEPEVALPVRA